MFYLSLTRRLRLRAAPLWAFAGAFWRVWRPAPPAPATLPLIYDLQAQIRDLQAEVDRLQPLAAQSDALQEAVHSAPDGVVIYNPDAGQITLNLAVSVLLGLPVGKAEAALLPDTLRYPSGQVVPPGGLPWAQAAATQTPAQFAPFLLAQADGILRPVEIAARPVPNGAAVAVVRDLSVLRAAQQGEAALRRIHHALADAAQLLGRAADLAALCQITTDAALDLLPPGSRLKARALLCTFGGRGEPITLQAVSPPPAKKRPRRHADTLPHTWAFDANLPLLWKVYLERQTVSSTDIAADPLFADPRARRLLCVRPDAAPDCVSALMLPLLPGAAATGHLLLTSPSPNAFLSPDLQDALTLLAAVSASALARAQGEAQRHRHDNQFAALRQAASASSDDALAQAAAHALGAAFAVVSRIAGPLPPGQARCPCEQALPEAMRRVQPAARVGIPNPPLGACRWPEFGGQSGTHSVLAVPLTTAPGALVIFRHGSAPFSPQEVRLAEIFAALVR